MALRDALPQDTPLLFTLICALAEYERAPERVTGGEELLRQALFGPQPAAEAVIAEVNGKPAGFALFFTTFSTWLCRPGLWLEDLFVLPEQRRRGVARALLGHLAQETVRRGYGRLEWLALDWNAPAIDFYRSLGAEQLHDWQGFRLEEEALSRLAAAGRGHVAG